MPDLFEQLVGDYLTAKGYLCRYNVNYRKLDNRQSGSDIDVLAVLQRPPHDVIVGDCKSWVDGVWPDWMAAQPIIASKARARSYFKAIFEDQWTKGLERKVGDERGTDRFSYVLYCAWHGDSDGAFQAISIGGNPIRVVTLAEMIRETEEHLDKRSKETKSVEPTTLGRFVQLMRHAGIKLEFPDHPE